VKDGREAKLLRLPLAPGPEATKVGSGIIRCTSCL
jgi:hypothetical protein